MVDDDKRARLSARLAALSPEQRALIRARLQDRQAPPSPQRAIPRREDDGPAPLSSGQRGIWLAEQLRSPLVSNLLISLRWVGPLDPDRLRQSLGLVFERHDILRTTFEMREDEPVQIVHERLAASFSLTDFSTLSASDRSEQLAALSVAESRRPHDLRRGPLLRAHLVKLDAAEHVLLLPVHHIVFDGWSIGLLRDELVAIYGALGAGCPPELPPLSVQYADYAQWQQQRLGSPELERQVAFWKRQLAGDVPALELPIDWPRSAASSHRGARVRTHFEPERVRSLEALERQHGVTRFMLLLAGLNVLLYRYTAQQDFGVGTAIVGRGPLETHHLLGYFLNMLVLRADLSGDPTFAELLDRVRDTCVGAYANAELPFDELVATLNPRGEPTRTTFFQVGLQLLPPGEQTVQAGPLAVSIDDPEPGMVWTELDVTAWEVDDELHIGAQYATDLFDEATVARMLRHFGAILHSAAEAPDTPISRLNMLTADDRRELEAASCWYANTIPTTTLDASILARCAQHPERIALVSGPTVVTYQQLSDRADQLAERLRAVGIGPGSLVGICAEPNAERVIGLLSVLCTGAAVLPLDPRFPEQRLTFMLEDAAPDALLVGPGSETLAAIPTLPRLDLATGAPHSAPSTEPPLPGTEHRVPGTGDRGPGIAYVTYTAGTTGRPKGVVVSHGAVLNVLSSLAEHPGLEEDDVLLAVTTFASGRSMLELFLPLMVGSRVVIASADAAADGEQLAALLDDHGVTVMQATPATWRLLIASGWPGSDRLKALCGGEAWPRSLAKELQRRCAEVWNVYGTTETAAVSAVQRVDTEPGSIRLGPPIANTQLHVLDPHGQPVPIGVPGELYVGGAGLADGYWRRPELTAQHFVADPFSESEDDRLCRTGDLVKRLADGTLELRGRLGQQETIRGYRVDLGEVEAALTAHPAVHDAAVVVRADESGNHRLVAYLVESSPVSRRELARHLAAQLPSYMVPSVFVSLPSLPLTPDRRIDRRALAAPDAGAELSVVEPIPPRTPMERRIAAIWREVLDTEAISVTHNFVALGGHSLLALRVVRRLREETGVGIRPRDLILHDLEQLAARCEALAPAPSRTTPTTQVETLAQKLLSRVKRVLGSD